MDETAGAHSDSTANGFDATAGGGVDQSAVGQIDGADGFDGVDDYLQVTGADAGLQITGDLTLEAWIWLDAYPASSGFDQDAAIVKFAGSGDGDSAENYLYSLGVKNNGDIYVGHESGTGADHFQDMGVTLNVSQWYQVTAVRDATAKEWNLFIDGAAVGGAFSYSTNANDGSNGDLWMGWDNEFLDGTIAEVRVSDTVRSADWIAAQHASGIDSFVSYGYEHAVAGVLGNDVDPDGDTLTATVVSGPSNAASFSLNADGSFDYTPVASFDGIDSFTYKANDGGLDSNVATVTINVLDVTAPTISARETIDSDGNGQIDQIRITTDDNLDDDFTGLTMTVAGYTVTGYSSGTANDNIFYADLTESGTPDSSATPTVTVAANTSLSDASDNNIAVDAGVSATDKAAPVLLSRAVADLDTDNFIDAIHLTFSEVISDASVQVSDFTLSAPGVTGLTFNPTTNGDTADDEDFYLTFDDGVHAVDITPRVSYAQSGGTDLEDKAASANAVANFTANDDPVNSVPGTQSTNENTALVFDTGGSNLISISDADAGGNPLEVTLNGANGEITLNGTAGLAFSTGDGTADANMTFAGTIADINAALDGLSFNPTPAFNGAASLQIVTNDQGNSGAGGPLNDDDTIAIIVNGRPTITSSSTANVVENSTTVLTVTATDPELDPISYSLTGGNDQARFSINATTGDLTFNAAPDFEAPTDVGSDNVYDVQVTAADGSGNNDVQSITVTDANDAPLITSASSTSVPENQTAVLTVTASDEDLPADTVTFSLTGGADQAKFSINATTGDLIFNSAPDYETPTDVDTDNTYEVQVTADDGNGGTDAQLISISVNPLNDNSPVFTTPATVNTDENLTFVQTVTATDADLPAQTVTYAISGGSDAGMFTIDSSTGNLSFLTAPDFETPADSDTNNIYEVQVTADDNAGNTTAQSISVTVDDVNDDPVITSSSTASVSENQTAVLTVTTTDEDLPTQTVSFAITGGADAGRFAVNATTGALAFNTAPDYEIPTDAGTNNVYQVQVTASDGNGGTGIQSISVTVNPVNDNAPVFTSSATGSLNENTTFVQTVHANDADQPGQTVTYSISGGIDAGFFSVNSTTGNLSFVTAPDFEAPADADANNIYEVQVTADDNSGSTTPQSISVTVADMGGIVVDNTTNDVVDGNTSSIPLLLANRGADGLISLREAIIAANKANDGVPDQIILSAGTYLLNRGSGDDNATNGDLDIKDDVTITGAGARTTIIDGNGLDRVFQLRDNSTATISGITVQGGDSGSGGGIHVEHSSTLFLTDAVLTGNNQNGGSGGSAIHVHGTLHLDRVLISNNTGVDRGAVTFHNADGGSLTNVTISGNTTTNQGGGLWTNSAITVTNSTIAFNTASTGGGIFDEHGLDVTISNTILHNPGSSNSNKALASGNYNIDSDGTASLGGLNDVVADPLLNALADNGGPTDTHSFHANSAARDPAGLGGAPVVDQRSVARIFAPDIGAFESMGVGSVSDSDAAASEVAENAANASLVGMTAFATDPNVGDTVTYGLDDDAGGRFTIDTTTGVVSVANGSLLDYETSTSHNITVRASSTDATSTTQVFTINLTPVDDNIPVITSTDSPTAPENQTNVLTVTASDADLPGDTITFAITGGSDQAKFSINATTGALTFNAAPDFETPTDVGANNVYEVQVTADDGNGGTDAQLISVTVIDGNGTPMIVSSATPSVAENQTAVLTVAAVDEDVPGDTLNFVVTGGADQATFSINAATGDLVFVAAPDFEVPSDVGGNNVYEVQVTVDDGTGNFDVQLISVNVTAVNDLNPVFISPAAVNVNENTTFVQTVSATDADLPAQLVTYLISGGNDAAFFTINASTGDLSFVAKPDFETAADFDADNIYEVQVTADDNAGGTTPQLISVSINDVNDAPSITSSPTPVVAENQTAVLTITTSDTDLPAQAISYTITGGPDAGAFSLNSATGDLTFNTAPDFEIPANVDANNIYEVQVTADDGNGGTDVQLLSVIVSPTNDNSPVFTTPTAVNVNETTTFVHSVNATDADLTAQVVTYSISGGNDAGFFTVDASTGDLSFLAARDFESAADLNADNVYEVQVTADDNSGNTTAQSINVTINDLNDAPLINSSATASVTENQMAVLTVTTADQDLPGDTITFALTGGADQATFAINATTGDLTFETAPDFEIPTDVGSNNVYDLQVTANDGNGGVDVQNVSVTVTAVNDYNPSFTTPAAVNIDEDTTFVSVVNASDADLPAQLVTYAISGGNDAGFFTINGSTGSLSLMAGADFEAPADFDANNIYEVQVTADDNAGNTTVQSISVTVDDVNDAPVITSSSTRFMSENQTAVLTVTTTDEDLPAQTMSYNITGGTDSGAFTINATTGDLAFSTAPDFEFPTDVGIDNSYEVQVSVDDGNGGADVQSITVTVTDTNDPPVITSNSTADATEDQTASLTITANDQDMPAQTVSYTITGGVDAGLFALDAITGELTFITAPDFDAPTDADSDSVYEVEVTADDCNGGTKVELIVFTISPAPLTSPPQTVEDAPAEPDLDSVDDSSDDSEVEQSEEKVLAQFAGGGTARESTRRNRTQTIQEQTATEAAAPAVGLLQDDNFPASQVLTEIVIDVAISEHVAASTLADLSTRRDFNSKAETKQLTPSDLASITSQHLLTTFAANGRTSIGLHQLKRDIHAQISFDDAVIGSVATVGSGLTAGYIMWAIRGGMLLSGLLAQMPVWTMIDPLLIADRLGPEGNEGDSLADIVDGQKNIPENTTSGLSNNT